MALDFLAGCLGGCAGVVVGHPFDTIKVRLQTDDFRKPQYRGTLHCLSTTIRNESVAGLYKGMSSPMAGVALVNAIVFGVYGNVQRRLPEPESYTSHSLAGAFAGACQALIASPMELVKTRLQLQDGSSATRLYSSPLDCLRSVFRAEGITGVFRGLQVTIWRDTPGFGCYFLAYEVLTKASQKDSPPLSTWQMLMAGGLAGTFSWVMTYPIDVIKSRLQVDGMTGQRQYSGIVDCYRKSVAAEGYGVLTRGLTSTILRAFPTNAACFTVVSWSFRLFGPQEEPATATVMSEHIPAAALLHKFDEHQLTGTLRQWKPLFSSELHVNRLIADSPGPMSDSLVFANFSQILMGQDVDDDEEEVVECVSDPTVAPEPDIVFSDALKRARMESKMETVSSPVTLILQ